MLQDRKQGAGQTHHPGQGQQQEQPGDHGQRQAQDPRAVALVLGQPAYQDGNEDDVVDTQDDFQGGQGHQGQPGLGAVDPFEHIGILLMVFGCMREQTAVIR